MASTLASQLKALGANNTVVLDKRKRKSLHSVSLIFEPNVAAQQDYETIYSIALEGLRELELIDTKFHTFEKSLFAESSIDVDREVQVSLDRY
jgi:U3 small nucleolar RNA-associated protein 10